MCWVSGSGSVTGVSCSPGLRCWTPSPRGAAGAARRSGTTPVNGAVAVSATCWSTRTGWCCVRWLHSASVQTGPKLVIEGLHGEFPQVGLVCGRYVNRIPRLRRRRAGRVGRADRAGRGGVRSAERRREGFRGAAPPTGGGTDRRPAFEVQTVGTRLRTRTRPRPGRDHGGDDPVDGCAPGRRTASPPRGDVEQEAARRPAATRSQTLVLVDPLDAGRGPRMSDRAAFSRPPIGDSGWGSPNAARIGAGSTGSGAHRL